MIVIYPLSVNIRNILYLTTGFPGDFILLALGAFGRLDDAIGVLGAAYGEGEFGADISF